jgi:hypothetical protein
MAGVKIKWNSKEFLANMKKLQQQAEKVKIQPVRDVALEIMRLSQFEVPHDKGLLQNSGRVEPMPTGAKVGYDKVYAARLHEHPEYKFQKGRKGKYLIDPIKNNLSVFQKIMGEKTKIVLGT